MHPHGGDFDDDDIPFTPQEENSINTEVGADLPGYFRSRADIKLDKVFGDHPHSNDGSHLSAGIPDDRVWQKRWRRCAQLSTNTYTVPKGRVGRRFVRLLADEFQGVLDRRWNSERPLILAKVILLTSRTVTRSADIRTRLSQRMDLWEKGLITSLIDDVEAEAGCRGPPRPRTEDATARAFNSRLLSGRIRSAVRNLTNRDGGGVLQPQDLCTKSGCPVLDVLREKHPPMREPNMGNPQLGIFEDYPDVKIF